MANQQLSDYVKQQLAKGASKESIRSALLGVGWQESDVKEALGETVTPVVAAPVSVSPVQPAAARPAASPAQTAVPVAAAPASVASASPSVSPVKAPVAETIKTVQMPDIKASPMVDMNSPSFRMDEIIFQSENKGSTPKTADPLKDAAVAKIAPVDAPKSAPSSSSKLLPALAIIVLAIELAAGGWFYYTNVMNSEDAGLPAENGDSMLQQAMSALQGTNNDLNAKITSLTAQVEDLGGQLSAFASPSGSSSEAIINLKGTVGGGSGRAYTITTEQNVVFIVKNYRDSKIEAVLKPLVGTVAQISGTHMIGSKDITVTSINGAEPAATAAAATGTTASGTVQATTTTPPAVTTTTPGL